MQSHEEIPQSGPFGRGVGHSNGASIVLKWVVVGSTGGEPDMADGNKNNNNNNNDKEEDDMTIVTATARNSNGGGARLALQLCCVNSHSIQNVQHAVYGPAQPDRLIIVDETE